jgi:hypothetical protein
MNEDGTDARPVVDRLAFFGRWSPDGKRVAAIVGKYPRTAIAVLSLGGTKLVWLTPPLPGP